LVVLVTGCVLVLITPSFPIRFVLACLTVILVDGLGGRWFGYAAIPFMAVGLLNDQQGTWVLMLPMIIGSLWAGLFMRHLESNWWGVPLGFLGFMAPLIVMLVLRSRLDPGLQLPLGGQFPLLYGITGAAGMIISGILWTSLARNRRLARAQAGSKPRRGLPPTPSKAPTRAAKTKSAKRSG
jgi:hypothetical protein